jgi:hypothetical protein
MREGDCITEMREPVTVVAARDLEAGAGHSDLHCLRRYAHLHRPGPTRGCLPIRRRQRGEFDIARAQIRSDVDWCHGDFDRCDGAKRVRPAGACASWLGVPCTSAYRLRTAEEIQEGDRRARRAVTIFGPSASRLEGLQQRLHHRLGCRPVALTWKAAAARVRQRGSYRVGGLAGSRACREGLVSGAQDRRHGDRDQRAPVVVDVDLVSGGVVSDCVLPHVQSVA